MNAINMECLLMPHVENVMKLLINDSLELDNGSNVQISKCPNGHEKIKSPLCCGQDMSCTV